MAPVIPASTKKSHCFECLKFQGAKVMPNGNRNPSSIFADKKLVISVSMQSHLVPSFLFDIWRTDDPKFVRTVGRIGLVENYFENVPKKYHG